MRLPLAIAVLFSCVAPGTAAAPGGTDDFLNPPDSARPGVYWYFMNGNLNGREMTADLESMKQAGIGNLVFLEVDIGQPPGGPVAFMSPQWQDLFVQSVRDAERLGIDISLGIGPGWCGSGGPWVKPEQAMQHLVYSTTELAGPQACAAALPVPEQRSNEFNTLASPFYEDVAVLAFPSRKPVITDIDEKALFERGPYTSWKHVKPHLPAPARHAEPGPDRVIQPDTIVDLTSRLKPDGTLEWNVPPGEWTIIRMGRRVTGASSRPAPSTAIGLESDKFDVKALEDHLGQYVGKLLEKIGPRAREHGLTTLHMDSWESGAQNWTPSLPEEFLRRRGYDARPWLPVYTGRAIQSLEMSERFLWDLRLTAQELVLENHAGAVKNYGRRHGLSLSIEPYDMNPAGDLDLGAVADVPMAEFWNNSPASAYSVFEATSIAHVMGKPIVAAEAFTSVGALDAYPWSLKNQGDWAFCLGINRIVFHTFAHQALGGQYKPGMAFGPYGVHWHRNQTWWPMVDGYHRYLARCSAVLRQGVAVADVLYLTPEGTPHIFLPPPDAVEGNDATPDKRGYGFDGCSPKLLMARAGVEDGRITFPGGTSYRLLVLPQKETMTPALLARIRDLVKAGATVVGSPPIKSPSLMNYPDCDEQVRALAKDLWGGLDAPAKAAQRSYGKGTLHWGGPFSPEHPVIGLDPLSESEWIWYPEGNPAQSAPLGTRYFQRVVELDAAKEVQSATAVLTADNAFTLWINGRKAAGGDNFQQTVEARIESMLRPGSNVLAVAVTNDGLIANPAGWIGAFAITFKDGSRMVVGTDQGWSAGRESIPGWELSALPPGSAGDWKDAMALGASGMAPWNLSNPGTATPPLYPSYELTASLLRDMGVKEDFTATGPVRYGHRRDHARDTYFVANRSGAPIRVECRFRIENGRPQLWDPVTGGRRLLPQFTHADGLTIVPMEFAAHQSFFVVFDSPGRLPAPMSDKNFPVAIAIQELQGAWNVAFDPKWGTFGSVAGRPSGEFTFDALQDWTTRAEPGIKYYSGIATYRKTFTLANLPAGRTYLDLGEIHDMARVRLNGRDLGVVWCAPWRVETSPALKAGENHLEIEVANRWTNRLIGDKQAEDANAGTVNPPPGFLGGQPIKTGRFTFCTQNPYQADSPLLPSGLLGPVRLLGTAEAAP